MMVEIVRMVADALSDATRGVNAQLATLPLRAGETEPPADIALIADETRTGWVARGEMPRELVETGPILAVYQAGDLSMPGERTAPYRAGTVDVGVRLIAGTTASATGTTALLDTMRAVERALRVMLADANQAELRTDNSVFIEISETWRQSPVLAVEDDAVVTATLLCTLNVRDLAPGV